MRPRTSFTLQQISEHVNGRLLDPAHAHHTVEHVLRLSDADEHALSYVDEARSLDSAIATTRAGALLVPEATVACALPAVAVRNPRLAFARVLALLHPPEAAPPGIHPTADVHATAEIDPTAHISPYCSVGAGTRIGAGAVLRPHVTIGRDCEIGPRSELRPRVVVGDHVRIGARCLIHPGSAIGASGEARKQPSVEIGDDVELGARARLEGGTDGVTRVAEGTKTDNAIHIGADAQIGPHCLMVSCSQVGRGAVLAHHATLAGQAMVLPKARVEAIAIVAARGKVENHVPARVLVSGDPAIPHKDELRRVANTMKLARLVDRLQETVSQAEMPQ